MRQWPIRSPIAVTKICTPMHMRRKAVSRMMTACAVGPMKWVSLSAER